MKKFAVLSLALFWTAGWASAQVQVGVSVGGGGDSFHLAIGSYYHAPQDQLVVCQQRHIPEEEMPVVFFVAQKAHVAPGVIINLRAGGAPWVNIFQRYNVNPRVLYVPVRGRVAGPYAGYYAYYRGDRRARLVDADIVNMVNLRFASDYYHRTPAEVMKLRVSGRNYRDIHSHYRPSPQPQHDNGLHRGEEKGRGHDKGRFNGNRDRHDDNRGRDRDRY